MKKARRVIWSSKKNIAINIFANVFFIKAIKRKNDNDIRANLGIERNVPVKVGISMFISEKAVRDNRAVFLTFFLIIKYNCIDMTVKNKIKTKNSIEATKYWRFKFAVINIFIYR